MYENIFLPVQALQNAKPKLGGVCSVKFFRWEDVLTWPAIDPQTGIMNTAIQMKPGTSIYLCEAVEPDRVFKETQKQSLAGDFWDMEITSVLAGGSASNTLSLQTMKFHQWGLILEDRNGVTRLIGNEDSGAELSFDYITGDSDSSRKTPIKWIWQHSLPAPIYTAEAFTIVIGGIVVTAGRLTLIMRFQVGHADAFSNPPVMNDGDTSLTRAALANKYVLVLMDGIAMAVNDGLGLIDWTGSIIRHIEKTFAGDTITWVNGPVSLDEICEIYEFS